MPIRVRCTPVRCGIRIAINIRIAPAHHAHVHAHIGVHVRVLRLVTLTLVGPIVVRRGIWVRVAEGGLRWIRIRSVVAGVIISVNAVGGGVVGLRMRRRSRQTRRNLDRRSIARGSRYRRVCHRRYRMRDMHRRGSRF